MTSFTFFCNKQKQFEICVVQERLYSFIFFDKMFLLKASVKETIPHLCDVFTSEQTHDFFISCSQKFKRSTLVTYNQTSIGNYLNIKYNRFKNTGTKIRLCA